MTDDERAVWQAAYAAAFVAEFDRNVVDVQPYTRGEQYVSRFDRAAQQSPSTAERAITIADLAVYRLRQWRENEQPSTGILLRAPCSLWDEDE